LVQKSKSISLKKIVPLEKKPETKKKLIVVKKPIEIKKSAAKVVLAKN